MYSRTFGWWFQARDVCAALTAPRTDVADADDRFERTLEDSRLSRIGATLSGTLYAAWLDSRVRSACCAIRSDWQSNRAGARAVGCTMFVAGITAVVAQTFQSTGRDPLTWAMPLAAAIGGLVLWWLGGRIASDADLPEEL